MTELYFFRHGQAGNRDDYDQLSDLGRSQARILGSFLARRKLFFDAALSGTLVRQRETALAVKAEFEGQDLDFPSIVPHRLWDEFDLDAVYREVAPLLAADDPVFARSLADHQARVEDSEDGIHRRWTETDAAIVRAWVESRFDTPGENWSAFLARIRSAAITIPAGSKRVAIFTSATPIAIWAALALQLRDDLILRLAGAQLNTAFSRMMWTGTEPVLGSFNETPHIELPEHFTYR